MKKLVLESTSPFQGLPELVAYDEGLFAKEGIEIEWADRDETGIKVADTSLTDVKGADPFVSHGTLLEQGKSTMVAEKVGAISVHKMHPHIGAEVRGVDLSQPLDSETLRQIK